MRILFVCFITFLTYYSYSQDMTVQQTVDYINKKFQANPSRVEGRGRIALTDSYYSVSIEKGSGKVILAERVNITDFSNSNIESLTMRQSFFVEDVRLLDTASYYKQWVITFHCNNNLGACIEEKASDIKKSQSIRDGQLDYFEKNRTLYYYIIPFENLNDAKSVINAFKHLFEKITTDKSYRRPEPPVDPFAPKVEVVTNDLLSNNKSNVVDMVRSSSGTYEVPVVINGVLKISFIFDSGASDISISPDVALTLIRTGTVKQSDFIGTQQYKFADGSTATSNVFILHDIKIGNKIAKDVRASISTSIDAPMLLGQSVLGQFGKFTIDNANHTLTIE